MIKCNAPVLLKIVPLHFLWIAGLMFILWNSRRMYLSEMFGGYRCFFFVFFSFNFFTTELKYGSAGFWTCVNQKVIVSKTLKTLKLEDTNSYVLRSILGYGKNTSYNHLLNMAGKTTLEERRKFQSLVLVCKCIHKNAPRYIKEFLRLKSVIII